MCLDPDLVSDHNGLGLKDMSSSNLRFVHGERERESKELSSN